MKQLDRSTPTILAEWTVPQAWASYTQTEHATWLALYERQMQVLKGRACDAFFKGLDALDLHGTGIPEFAVLNPKLQALTGWTIVPVAGLVPDEVFFELLYNRQFPAGRFIRQPEQMDYLEEPDIFHDVFGHVPMLTDPALADFLAAFGRAALRAAGNGHLARMARLYWYTIEFGLVRSPDGLRLYGAGIASSPGESVFSLESPSPHRLGFDLERAVRTLYRTDDLQQTYFVIDSLDELLSLAERDFDLDEAGDPAPDLPIGALLPSDVVFSLGTQAYAQAGGRLANANAAPHAQETRERALASP